VQIEPKIRAQYEEETTTKIRPGEMGVFDGARNLYSTLKLANESRDGYLWENLPLPPRPRDDTKPRPKRKPPTCFNCQKEGHKVSECPDELKEGVTLPVPRPKREPRTWTIRVQLVAQVSPPELMSYAQGKSKDFPQKVVQALDIVLAQVRKKLTSS